MLKIVLAAALMIGVAACAPRDEQPPAMDTTTTVPVTPAPADTPMPADTMARDTARDTTGTR